MTKKEKKKRKKSKWIRDLNIRPETIKHLEANRGGTLFDINHSNRFLDLPPKVMKTKTKMNKWDLIKVKSFWKAMETINKMKTQPQNGRKYLQTKLPTRD